MDVLKLRGVNAMDIPLIVEMHRTTQFSIV